MAYDQCVDKDYDSPVGKFYSLRACPGSLICVWEQDRESLKTKIILTVMQNTAVLCFMSLFSLITCVSESVSS